MYKAKYYRAPKPAVNPSKSAKPKPQWVTDFSDPDKYKLTQSEMIQRKAALQSKNRQTARQDLQERRKKLQMGIIDEDTRKVYETALQSKKIDLNPPIRKNLSQMIQYERQKREEQKYRYRGEQPQNEDEFEKEIKQTQHFIKKLQKAKKQTKIQKAVDILLDEPKSSHFGPTKSNQLLEQNTYNEEQSQDDALSNIQQTIKFMEMKLFGNKKTEQSMISPIQTSKNQKEFKLEEDHDTSRNEFLDSTPNQQQTLELSHLKMDIPVQHDEDECMSTIRRMQEMIESKENLFSQNLPAESEKRNRDRLQSMKYSESQPEIDFNLTMNESEEESLKIYEPKEQKFKKEDKKVDTVYGCGFDYEAVKKNLFEQVDKLENFSMEQSEYYPPPKKQKITKYYEQQQESYEEPRVFEKEMKVKKPKVNSELEELKSMVNTTKNNLSNIRVEEIGSSSNMMGFDFRGSINIKKNIIKK